MKCFPKRKKGRKNMKRANVDFTKRGKNASKVTADNMPAGYSRYLGYFSYMFKEKQFVPRRKG